CAACAQLRAGLSLRRAGGRASCRHSRPHAHYGREPAHAQFRGHHRRRRRQSGRCGARWVIDRTRGWRHHHLLSGCQRGGYLPHHGRGAGCAAAWLAWPGRSVRMTRRVAVMLALGLVLVTVPWWLPLAGGYTALGTKVLVYGLAAIALNLLIGF